MIIKELFKLNSLSIHQVLLLSGLALSGQGGHDVDALVTDSLTVLCVLRPNLAKPGAGNWDQFGPVFPRNSVLFPYRCQTRPHLLSSNPCR